MKNLSYIATGRVTVKYTAAAWLPWVSISMMEKLEMCQRYAGRAITGQIKTTQVQATLAEADLPTVATHLSTMVKPLCMPDPNPRKQTVIAKIRLHTKKTCWRKKAI